MTRRALPILVTVWIALLLGSFLWNDWSARRRHEGVAKVAARSFFQQIEIARQWNARHGSVYVPVTAETPPNEYLDAKGRDPVTADGRRFTQINPAYMTRQIGELAAESEGIQFHLTSLRPVRPQNAPTTRERHALEGFERGVSEVGRFVDDGHRYFYMAPLITTAACMKCHADNGYKVGQVRGGISVTLPVPPYEALGPLLIGHGLAGLAGLAGLLMLWGRLRRAYDTIARQSVMDALTGIPNRRLFTERMLEAVEAQRAGPSGRPLSVVMADVDWFKSFNDTYGHQVGDTCLRAVAQALEQSITAEGHFGARYGGEEFVVILPETHAAEAQVVAERIRHAVESLALPHSASPLKTVTLSLGVATLESGEGVDPEELVKMADQALYVAKGNGRNRVEVYGPALDGGG